MVDELPVDEELVARILALDGPADRAFREVEHDLFVADVEQDRLVDPRADHVGLLDQRSPPVLELGQ